MSYLIPEKQNETEINWFLVCAYGRARLLFSVFWEAFCGWWGRGDGHMFAATRSAGPTAVDPEHKIYQVPWYMHGHLQPYVTPFHCCSWSV